MSSSSNLPSLTQDNISKWLKNTKLNQDKTKKMESLNQLKEAFVPMVDNHASDMFSASTPMADVRRHQAVALLPSFFDDLCLLERDPLPEVRAFVADMIGGLTARSLSLQLVPLQRRVDAATRAVGTNQPAPDAAAMSPPNHALDALSRLLLDPSAVVVKAAVRAATLLLRPLLATVCAELAVGVAEGQPAAAGGDDGDAAAMDEGGDGVGSDNVRLPADLRARSARLDTLDQLVSAVAALSVDSSNTGIRVQALKFLEQTVLAFSTDVDAEDDGGDSSTPPSAAQTAAQALAADETVMGAATQAGRAVAAAKESCDPVSLVSSAQAAASVNLRLAPPGPLGQSLIQALKTRGDQLESTLVRLLQSHLSSALAAVLVNSLVSLSKAQPKRFLPTIVPALVSFSTSPPAGLAASQINSLKHVLKVCLLSLLQLRTPAVLPVAEPLVEVLTSELGLHPDQAWQAAKWIRSERLKQQRAEAVATAAARAAGLPEGQAAKPKVGYNPVEVLATIPPPDQITSVALAEIVMYFMGNLPPEPVEIGVDATFVEQQQQLLTGQSATGSNAAAAAAAAASSLSLSQQQQQQLQQLQQLQQEEYQDALSTQFTASAVVPEGVATASGAGPSTMGDAGAGAAAGPTSIQRPRLLALPLAPGQCEEIAVGAFNRVLKAENGVRTSGGDAVALRQSLLVRLVRARPLDDTMVQSLIAHLCDQFADRMDLAHAWLLHEWVLEKEAAADHNDNGVFSAAAKPEPVAGHNDAEMVDSSAAPAPAPTPAPAEEGGRCAAAAVKIEPKAEAAADGDEDTGDPRLAPSSSADVKADSQQGSQQQQEDDDMDPELLAAAKREVVEAIARRNQAEAHRYEELLLALIENLKTQLISAPSAADDAADDGATAAADSTQPRPHQQQQGPDMSIARFLVDVPELTDRALDAVSELCSDPAHLTVGLSALRDLILSRPVSRDQLLQRLLAFAVHRREPVRLPAVRLTVNKLYAVPDLASAIEKFAVSTLGTAVQEPPPLLDPQAEQESGQQQQQPQPQPQQEKEQAQAQSETDMAMRPEKTTGNEQPTAGQEAAPAQETAAAPEKTKEELEKEAAAAAAAAAAAEKERAVEWAQSRVSLFFALCTKKPSLLPALVPVYGPASTVVRRVMHLQLAGLARTLGPKTPDLLQFIGDCPAGAETLVLQVLHSLTENRKADSALCDVVLALYERTGDARFLIPVLSGLTKAKVEAALPKLVALPPNVVKNMLHRLSQQKEPVFSPTTPTELLLLLHNVDAGDDRVLLKKLMDAIQMCFENRAVFTQEVTASSLQRLLNSRKLAPLFMRTVILALGRFPRLTRFVLRNILSGLIQRKVWDLPLLWEGFIKACRLTQPDSAEVLARLPPKVLEKLLERFPEFKGIMRKKKRRGGGGGGGGGASAASGPGSNRGRRRRR